MYIFKSDTQIYRLGFTDPNKALSRMHSFPAVVYSAIKTPYREGQDKWTSPKLEAVSVDFFFFFG